MFSTCSTPHPFLTSTWCPLLCSFGRYSIRPIPQRNSGDTSTVSGPYSRNAQLILSRSTTRLPCSFQATLRSSSQGASRRPIPCLYSVDTRVTPGWYSNDTHQKLRRVSQDRKQVEARKHLVAMAMLTFPLNIVSAASTTSAPAQPAPFAFRVISANPPSRQLLGGIKSVGIPDCYVRFLVVFLRRSQLESLLVRELPS